MKKTFIAISILVSSLSLMSVYAVDVAGCATQNGITVCTGVGGFNQQGAAVNQNVGGSLGSLLATAQTLVNNLVPFAIGIAVLALFFGIIKFIIAGQKGDEKGHADAIKFMMMAILALFVMVSIWGLVGFLGSVVGVGQGGSVPVPSIPTGRTN